MKKVLLIITFVISSMPLPAQTKEETIGWLNVNAGTLLNSTLSSRKGDGDTFHHSFVEVKGDSLHFYERMYCPGCTDAKTVQYHYYIPVKSILFQDINTLSDKESDSYDGKRIVIHLKPGTIYKYTYNGEWKEEDHPTYFIYYKRDEDVNVKRVIKAILHLAKLSGAVENKQTF